MLQRRQVEVHVVDDDVRGVVPAGKGQKLAGCDWRCHGAGVVAEVGGVIAKERSGIECKMSG